MSEKDNKDLEVTESVSTSNEEFLKQVVSAKKNNSDEDNKPEKSEKEKKFKKLKEPKEINSQKKIKHGMMSSILTIVFVVVVVLVNVVATTLFERYPMKIDLTSEKIYSISQESEDYVKSIDVETIITIFDTEEDFTALSTYTQQATEFIKRYCQYNDKISYRFVDIDSNPDIVGQYEANTISLYDIIVETNPTEDVKRIRKITLLDLVEFSDDFVEGMAQYGMTIEAMAAQYGDMAVLQNYGGYVESSATDQAFLSAFMTVTDPNPTAAVFLTGRNEASSLSYLHTLLEANGYTVMDIDITTEEIPADASIVFMAGPQTDYLPEEVDKVDEFLNNDGNLGKNLVYMASQLQKSTPNIDEFLVEYGIEIGMGYVCESNASFYSQEPYNTYTINISDKFTQDLTTDENVLINYASRPIKLLFKQEGQIGTEAYVTSTDNALVANPETEEISEMGEQIYTAVSSKVVFNDDSTSTYSNVIVYGSADTLSDQLLGTSQFQNREYVISLLNGVTHKTEGVYIEPKVIEGNVFDITDKQKTILKVTFILIIPVVVLVLGLTIWYRRKNR